MRIPMLNIILVCLIFSALQPYQQFCFLPSTTNISLAIYYPWLRWIEISELSNNVKKAKALYQAYIFDTVCSGPWEPAWSVSLQAQAASASLCLTLLLSWDHSCIFSPSEDNITRLWEGREELKRVLTLPFHTPGGQRLWKHCCISCGWDLVVEA